jgi:hypothetical protein
MSAMKDVAREMVGCTGKDTDKEKYLAEGRIAVATASWCSAAVDSSHWYCWIRRQIRYLD